MLSSLRKNTKVILWILLLFIVPPFVFFGIGTALKSPKNPIAGEIFGKKIRIKDLAQAVYEIQLNMKLKGEEYSKEDSYELERLAWQRLIILEKAKKEGLSVSKEELADKIIKLFSIKNNFDEKYYQNTVTRILNMSIPAFEENMRRNILIDKMKNMIINTVKIMPDEVKNLYQYENENINAVYSALDKDTFAKNIEITDLALNDFFEKNKENYQMPDKRKCVYIKISIDAFLKDAQPQEKEIEEYYEKNKEEFKNDKGGFKPLNDVKSSIAENIRRIKAQQAQTEKTEKVFSILIENQNIKKTAENSGFESHESDFIGLDDKVEGVENSKIFTNTLFDVNINEFSDPVKSGDSYYIIQPSEEKKAYTPEFKDVAQKVKADYIENKSYDMAVAKAKEIIDRFNSLKISKLEDFSKFMKEEKLEVIKIEPFNRRGLSMNFSEEARLKNEALNITPGSISNVIVLEKGPAIIFVAGKSEVNFDEFEKQKEYYTKKLLARKQEIVLTEWYRDLLKDCKVLNSLKTRELEN